MKREEMVAEREQLQKRCERLTHIGDYGAGASDIRENAIISLKLIEHLLERMKA